MPRRYAILDRDGTIIVEKGYLKSVEELEILPGSLEGLQALAEQGFGFVVITNQSGIGRGMMTVDDVEAIHSELQRRLPLLERFYYCPHAPSVECSCRKPKVELARRAARELGFKLSEALFIGDKESDIEFGHNCAARSILVRTGYGSQHAATTKADAVADDLADAARLYSISTWK